MIRNLLFDWGDTLMTVNYKVQLSRIYERTVIKMQYITEYGLPCLYSFIASIAFGIQFNIKLRHIVAAGAGGVVCQFVYMLIALNGASEALACFFGAVTISLYSEILARRLRVPVNMYLVIGIIPLVPGSYIYNTMIVLVNGDIDAFLRQFTDTMAIAGAIAMGVFAVSSVIRLLNLKNKRKSYTR